MKTTTHGTFYATTPQPHGSTLVVVPEAKLKRVPLAPGEYESVDGEWYVRRIERLWYISYQGTGMYETDTLREAQEYVADDAHYPKVAA